MAAILAVSAAQAGEKAKVVVDQANVMLGEKAISTLPKGTEFEVIGRHQQWLGVRVNVNGQMVSGWVNQRDVQIAAPGGMVLPVVGKDGKKGIPVPHLLACVRAKGINTLMTNAQQMLMQVNPVLAGFVSAEGFGQNVGWEGLKGLDRDAPFCILILNPDKFGEPAVMLLPITNFEEIPQEGVLSFRNLGKFALAGRNTEALDVVAGVLEGVAGVSMDEMKGDLEFRADIKAIMDAAGPHIEEGMKEMSQAFSQLGQMGAGQMNPEMLGAIFKAEIDWLLDMAKQSSEATCSLSMTADGLRLGFALTANQGSKLTEWFGSVPVASHKLATALPAEEALMTFSGECGTKGWPELYTSILEKLLPAFNLPAEDSATLMNSTKSFIQKMDGAGAATFNVGKDGISGVFCMGATQGPEIKATVRELGKLMSEGKFTEFYKQAGVSMEVSFKPAARTKDGVEIDLFSYKFVFPEGAEQNPIQQQQMKMMKALYGDTLAYEIAYLDKVVLATLGKAASQEMDALIARAKQGGGTIPQTIQASQSIFGKDCQFYGTYSLKKMVEVIEAIGGLVHPGFAAGAAPAVEIPGPPIAFSGKAKDNRAEVEVFIPVKPFASLQVYFMQKMQQMQPKGGEGEGEAEPPATF
jgi:hypothetical protein